MSNLYIQTAEHALKIVGANMNTSLEGTITYFNPQEGKEFGFIAHNNESVFFHINRFYNYHCNGSNDPVLRPAKIMPEKGMIVMFKLYPKKGSKGPAAFEVAPKTTYEKALIDIQNRPTFRLVHRTGLHEKRKLFTGDEYKYRIVWEGKNLTEIRASMWDSYSVFERPGSAQYYQWFNIEANEWQPCADPRINQIHEE